MKGSGLLGLGLFISGWLGLMWIIGGWEKWLGLMKIGIIKIGIIKWLGLVWEEVFVWEDLGFICFWTRIERLGLVWEEVFSWEDLGLVWKAWIFWTRIGNLVSLLISVSFQPVLGIDYVSIWVHMVPH